MADKQRGDKQHEGTEPETRKYSSGDKSGQGRPRQDDDVFPEGGGRNEFGTHGGPHGEGNQRKAPSENE